MSTSVKETAFGPWERASSGAARTRPTHVRIALRYAVVAAGCIAFNFIYAQFAHGVSSSFMTFMFAIPLAMGVLPALGLQLAKARPVPVAARQFWGLAVACLTVASCLHGVFDIAGTASPYLPAYVAAAGAFIVAAAVAACRRLVVRRDKRRRL